ncbi:unnamed protein product [marine sediment metagenome]|uniref:Uncharacterized protein n=1 Tax=marine sediment metagenome TaxID=412755 RepID=X0XCH1_9ZZZZ
MICPKCKSDDMRHEHDTAHGIVGTHMVGSERFTCSCGLHIDNKDDAEKIGLTFTVDT